jgi:ribonuclease Z
MQLLKQDTDPASIDDIFITHHHYDHICDLGELLLTAWHNGRLEPVHVNGPEGTSQIVDALLNQVYRRDIDFALYIDRNVTDIRQLIRVKDLQPGMDYESEGCRVFAEYVNHGNSLGLSIAEWPCLGYRLEAEGKTVAIGGDTTACVGLEHLAKGADVLVLSCYLADQEISSPGFERLANHIIASSGQAGKIAALAGVQKLVLTHFRKKSEALMQSLIQDVRKDFTGDLYIAEDGVVIEV